MGNKGTKLVSALNYNNPEIVLDNQKLLKKLDNETLEHLLIIACDKNYIKVVKVLMEHTQMSTHNLFLDALRDFNTDLVKLFLQKKYFKRIYVNAYFENSPEILLKGFVSSRYLTKYPNKMKDRNFIDFLKRDMRFKHRKGKLNGLAVFNGRFEISWRNFCFLLKRNICLKNLNIFSISIEESDLKLFFKKMQFSKRNIPFIFKIVKFCDLRSLKIMEELFKDKYWNALMMIRGKTDGLLLSFNTRKAIANRKRLSYVIALMKRTISNR